MRRVFHFLAMIVIVLISYSPAEADAAPPRTAPGNGILPQGETRVQMLAEAVLIAIDPSGRDDAPVEITADFTMRNQGEAPEQMMVRFPLEALDGMGDGWGMPARVSNFAAFVGGDPVPVSNLEEPFAGGLPIAWAAFPVQFLPQTDTSIRVRYSTFLYGSENDLASVDYILETGAGWYGPIGSAVIVLRLPYAASASNVLSYYYPEKVNGPAFVGREARWDWIDFEPSRKDDLHPDLVWPSQWKKALALEASTGENPADEAAAIQLAETYRTAGSERHGFCISDALFHLGRNAIEQALVARPTSPKLLGELIALTAWRCDSYPPCGISEQQELISAFRRLGAADPQNPALAEWQPLVDSISASLTATPTEAPLPAEASATATHLVTPTATGTATTVPLPRNEASLPVQSVVPAEQKGEPIRIALGFAVGAILGGSMVALYLRRRNHSPT
jgi:hypothetical protein